MVLGKKVGVMSSFDHILSMRHFAPHADPDLKPHLRLVIGRESISETSSNKFLELNIYLDLGKMVGWEERKRHLHPSS